MITPSIVKYHDEDYASCIRDRLSILSMPFHPLCDSLSET